MYSLTYNDRTIRRFKCKDGVFRLLAKDIGDTIGSTNISRDFGSHGTKAVTIVVESLIPSLTLNERTSMLVTLEETLNFLDTRRKKNQSLCIPLKQFLIEHWDGETDETKMEESEIIEVVSTDSTMQFKINTNERFLCIGTHNIPFAYDVTGRIAFRAINVCLFLEYKDTEKAVRQHTSKDMRVDFVFDIPPEQVGGDNSLNDRPVLTNEERVILHG